MRQKHKWRERHTGRHTNRDTVRVTERNTHTETHTLKGTHTELEGTTENAVVRWHHQLIGHEFEQALRVGDGQASPACCGP